MRKFVFLATALLLCGAATVQAQGNKIQSPAELFPADTLMYAEVQKPGELAKEVRGLFKGSYLFNVPQSMDRLEAKFKEVPPFGWSGLKAMGLLLAPEIVKEMKRGQGAAIGFTSMGFPIRKKGHESEEPEFLAVVLPGKSNIPSFVLRSFISATTQPVEKVEGVTLYRMAIMTYSQKAFPKDDFKDFDKKNGFKEEKELERENGSKGKDSVKEEEILFQEDFQPKIVLIGPAYAMAKGALLVGTPELVKGAILRLKGKGPKTSLASLKSYQQAQKELGGKPGIFAFGNTLEIMESLEDLPGLGAQEKIIMGVVTELVNPKAFQGAGYSLTLENGTLEFREVAFLDPKEKSPILELYPSAPFNTELLAYAPQDASLVFGISNNDGEDRLKKIVALVNQFVPPDFRGLTPADHLKRLEDRLGVNLAKDVSGQITNVAFVLGNPFTAPVKRVVREGPNFRSVSETPEIPMFLLIETKDNKAAKKLADLLPTVAEFAEKHKVETTTKMVKGQKITSLRMNPDYSLEYVQDGNVLIIGPSLHVGPAKGSVAEALMTKAKKTGLTADKELVARLKAKKDALGVTLVKPMPVIFAALTPSGYTKDVTFEEIRPDSKDAPKFEDKKFDGKDPNKEEKRDRPIGEKGQVGFGFQKGEKGQKVTRKVTIVRDSQMQKLYKEFRPILSKESWFLGTITRSKDSFEFAGSAPNLNKIVPAVTNFALEKYLQEYNNRDRGFDKETDSSFDSAVPKPKKSKTEIEKK